MTATNISNANITRTFTALTGRACTTTTTRPSNPAAPDAACFVNVYVEGDATAVAHGAGYDANDARFALMRDVLERFADWFVCRAVQTHSDLARASITWLRGEYKRNHRVCDVREMTKSDFVVALLRDSIGERAATAALALPRTAYTWLEDQTVVPGK